MLFHDLRFVNEWTVHFIILSKSTISINVACWSKISLFVSISEKEITVLRVFSIFAYIYYIYILYITYVYYIFYIYIYIMMIRTISNNLILFPLQYVSWELYPIFRWITVIIHFPITRTVFYTCTDVHSMLSSYAS